MCESDGSENVVSGFSGFVDDLIVSCLPRNTGLLDVEIDVG